MNDLLSYVLTVEKNKSIRLRCAIFLCSLVLRALVCDAQPVSDILLPLDGEMFSTEEFSSGRYALAFVVVQGCPACMQSVPWLWRAAEAFPEIRFILVTPESSIEFQSEDSGGISVLLDQEGKLGGAFQIHRVPEVSFLVEGVIVKEVGWPFSEGELLRACAESLLIEIQRPEHPSWIVKGWGASPPGSRSLVRLEASPR